MVRLSKDLLRVSVNVECPNCDMGFEVSLMEVAYGIRRQCPVCHRTIRLEADSSFVTSLREVDRQVQRLTDGMQNL